MTVKLSNDDRCAIDLVLEQRAGDGSVSEHCFGKSSASLRMRVERVEQLFDLLAQMRVEEPRTQLLAKTLKHVQRHQHDTAVRPETAKGVIISHPMLHRPLQ